MSACAFLAAILAVATIVIIGGFFSIRLAKKIIADSIAPDAHDGDRGP